MLARFLFVFVFMIAFKKNVVDAFHPCEFDLEQTCGIRSPQTQSEIYNARFCLGSNLNLLTNDCSDYVRFEAPSFIEACVTDIHQYCHNVPKTSSDVQTCLNQHRDEVQVACQKSLDQKYSQMEGLTWPSHEAVKDYNPELKAKQMIEGKSNKFYSNFLNTYNAATSASIEKKEQENNNLRGKLEEIHGSQELLLKFSKKLT